MEAMNAGRDDSLAGLIVTRATEKDPELADKYENRILLDMARNGIKRARSHGLENTQDLQTFVGLMFVVAPNFDEQPEIRAVLSDESIPAGEKIEKLKSPLISEKAWEEAKNNHNEEAWKSAP